MDTIFGKARLVGQAKITKADGTVEVVDISDDLAKDEGLLQRLLSHMTKEK